MVRAGHALFTFFLTLYALLPAAGNAETLQYEGKKILNISFAPYEQPVDPEELFRILPLKRDTPLHIADVRAAINRLYATGRYEDIQVDAELQEGGVTLRFLTVSSWFIGGVSVVGNVKDPPNAGQLVNASRLNLGEPFVEENITKALSSLEDLLEGNGYYNARVLPRYRYDPRNQQVYIEFLVATGRRAKYSPPTVIGETKIPERSAIDATAWKGWFGWKPVTQARTQRGLERIREKYQKQDRLMASVSLDDLEYDSEHVTLKATINAIAGPKVEVRTVGFKVPRSRLKKYIPIYEERTVDRDLLAEGVRNLRDYFQAQGYFEVEIEFKEQQIRNDQAVIDYLINPGKRHSLVSIGIDGNKYFDTATIRERMYLLPNSLQFRRGRYSESLLRRDEETIANLYRENGFRDVKVTSSVEDDYQGKTGHIAVNILIAEGSQWFVSSLTLEGVEQLSRDSVLNVLSSLDGQPFSEFSVALDRDAILTKYFSEGFPNARFEWSSKPAAKPQQVDLRFAITEGERRFVRQVLVSGLDTTQPAVVNRNILLNPGDPLSQVRMVDTQRRLYDLGIFARVNMAIQNPEGDNQNKYVLYQVEEAKRYSVTSGLGAEIARIGGNQASLDSPAGKAGFSPRVSLDLSRLNFRGLGHTLSFRSRVSNIQRRALVNYLAPRIRDNAGMNLTFTTLYDDSRDVRTFAAKRQEGSVQLSQRVSKATTALYRFSYRRVSVSSVKINELALPLLSQPVRIGIASGSFFQDKRDDPVESHKGTYNTADFGLASRVFGSQADFTRFLGRNSSYYQIGKKIVFARSVNFGWLNPVGRSRLFHPAGDPTQDLPLAERFFSGGANTHRGFPENQAGPRDLETGFPLGGQALLFHNAELRFPLIGDNIAGVLFHDAGNTFSRLQNISLRYNQRDLKDFDYTVHA
ncbi:MAG: POTRA domain-containing protein, partial [Bryobacteraceae bacterium]